ncbi:MAG: hemolysin III family protein [Bacteroidales bacterium]|nr:hemolysin III family protein [Bacteroidales bacterium]
MIYYSKNEDRLNAISHAFGILLGIVVGIIFLIWCYRADDHWAGTAVSIYLTGMLASYVCSTVYHAIPSSWPSREWWRRLDHAAIYWHIAGSYSPITLIAMQNAGWWGWGLFAFVWVAAIAGTVVSFIRLDEHSYLETTCFVLMGLSVLVAFKPLMQCVDSTTIWWLIAEGFCYITGAVIFAFSHNRPYVHTIFHFFVLAGSVCHIVCIWKVLMQYVGL